MIVLDTNVVSEPMRPRAHPAVQAWLDLQTGHLGSATSFSEPLVGVENLPPGRRKDGLSVALMQLISGLFGPRILAFDQEAARTYATVVTRARAGGHAIGFADGQTAAIAAVHGFTVATRDTAPFRAAGVPVVNPWEQGTI